MKKVPTKKKCRRPYLIGILCFLLIGGSVAFFLYENNRVYKECYVEAGVKVTVQDFLVKPDERAYFTEDSAVIDSTVPGEYHVKVKTGIFPHKSTLYVTDTIPPQGTPAKKNLPLGEKCAADAFVSDILDATQVMVTYGTQPDFTVSGKQDIQIVLTDLGGNQTTILSELFLSQIASELTVEAGSKPPKLEDFVIAGEEAAFVTDIRSFDYAMPSDQIVQLRVDGIDYESTMHITDTIAPTVEVQEVHGFTLFPKTAEDFILSIEDATETEAAFVKEPDFTFAGEQAVEIRVTDAGGNETLKTARLILEKDTEPPAINGAADLSVLVGKSVSYQKNVTVTDNCPEGLTLTVDNSAVNLNAEGVYPVTYTAKDLAGNQTTVTVSLTVLPKSYDIEEVNALADSVLAKIFTPEMSPEQKLEAIYSYNQSHIAYINYSDKSSWVRAAYEGLAEGKGDCYVYASTAKALLDRAGITNMDIEKIPTRSTHYWNLVDVGYGWYHFDTTPRAKDHPHICMWTEAQLMEYSAAHSNSHNYDHSLYPEVN